MSIDPFSTAVTLAAQLQGGRISARELLEVHLARIERHNPRLNAIVTLDAERARGRADELDALQRSAGALHGLAVSIKDSFETAGMRTTCGAPQWKNHVPTQDADAVRLLAQAGAVFLGKSNVPIYTGDLQSYNLLFGATCNPWDFSRTSGGSSGGATAAVAAGLSVFELGSDIGGSIRIPAHFCGVYGHKPTYGVVPMRGHVPPPPGAQAVPDLAVAGPIARSAEDIGMLMDVLAPGLPVARARRLADFRIGLWLGDPMFPIDDAVKNVLSRSVESLRRAGANLDEQARPLPSLAESFDDYLRLLWPVTTAHLSEKAFARLQAAGAGAQPGSMHERLARYSRASHREWLALDEKRQHTRAMWRVFFERYDILLCPVGPVCAFAHDHGEDLMARGIRVNGEPRWYWEQLAWISLATLAYLPALSAPVGRSDCGLPVGIQIIGPHGEDRTCIEFARLLAEIVPGFEPPPLFI